MTEKNKTLLDLWLGNTDPSGCPRPEYPEPMFMRTNWMNLNGEWEFAFDQGRTGEARGMMRPEAEYPQKITVPFCPQSKLSGIGFTDFIYGCWYRRTVTLTKEHLSRRVMLHFGAVDHYCAVYVNGENAGTHTGGFVPFAFDVTELLHAGENRICVYAEDDERDPRIPVGKQSWASIPSGCLYTRTTGIWQTVWLEFVPETRVESMKIAPLTAESAALVELNLCGDAPLRLEAQKDGKTVGRRTVDGHTGTVRVILPLDEVRLWAPENPEMYALTAEYGEDRVTSFFGLRDIRLDHGKFLLNGRSVFQRTVLDQGFYPDGIYTAPAWSDLERDILLGQAMGFNGARLHQKVFEPIYLFLCDCYGYMAWGEYPSWGFDISTPAALAVVLPEWRAVTERDYNHPAIIGWCPFNEAWDSENRDYRRHDDTDKPQCEAVLLEVYETTKALDTTRPCIDTSGGFHVKTDIYDVHDYRGDAAEFKKDYDRLITDNELPESLENRGSYRNRRHRHWDGKAPVFVSEYGGIGYAVGEKAWGYGDIPVTEEAFMARFAGLTDALLDNPKIMGFCYTQLTNVEGEQNGLYTYDRVPKFDAAKIRAVVARKAAIETDENT